ncbi:MAG: redoxin domain-containing protein [Hymenobacter sp.]
MLTIGTQAPDFELSAGPDQTVKLHELQGKKVILAFTPPTGAPCAATRWRSITKR